MTYDLAKYIFDNYSELRTKQENLAFRHLAGAMKATLGNSDLEAQATASQDRVYSHLVSDDPEVLQLARDGYSSFVQKTAERMLRENGDKIVLNRCPARDRLTRTPHAKQCPHCYPDWHGKDSDGIVIRLRPNLKQPSIGQAYRK